MVQIFRNHGIKAVTISGGEPLINKRRLFEFLRLLHRNQIHTTISTTGFGLKKYDLEEMNRFVDRLVISIRSLSSNEWKKDFGPTPHTEKLRETVINLLSWIKETEIKLEVNSVMHKENIDRISALGHQLLELNANIYWRIDEYFPIGLEANNRHRFQLEGNNYEIEAGKLIEEFKGKFRDVLYTSWKMREHSPGLLVTQSGDIITSADSSLRMNVFEDGLPEEIPMSRTWSKYKMVLRDWGWGDI